MIKNADYLLSIIIPTYNNAEFITPVLSSLLIELTEEVEIIIINDGSTDETDEKVTDFCRIAPMQQIKYIQQKNQGVAVARNVGLANASGKYIAFIDGDDLISPDYYNVLLPLLREEQYSLVEFDLTRDSSKLYRKESNAIADLKKEEIIISDNDYSALAPTFRASQWHLVNKIFHRNIIGNEKFAIDRRYEDLILIPFQYFKCHKILKIDVILYYYRVNLAGITENIRESDAENMFFAMRKMSDFIKYNDHLRTIATYMMVNCFLEGRKIIRKKKGFYTYSNEALDDIKSVLDTADLNVINKKVLKKMQYPMLDTFISKLNYQLLKIIKKPISNKEN